MSRKFWPDTRTTRQIVRGSSDYEIRVIGRLNAEGSRLISGRHGTFIGGDTGNMVNHFSGPLPRLQNFGAPQALRPPGNTTGYRTTGSIGLPNRTGQSSLRNQLLPQVVR